MSIFLIIAVLFWGLSYIAIKICLDYLTPVEMIAARFVLGALTLGIIIKIKGLRLIFVPFWKPLLLSALILFLHFWIMATGMMNTTATNTAWILTTAPIFIAVLSYFVLKESMGRKQIVGIVLATAGVIILVSKGDIGSLDWISSTGDWIVLASCVTWAIYTLITRKLTQKLNPLVATFWMIVLAGSVIVPSSLFYSGINNYVTLPSDGLIALIFLGVGCLAISFWSWSEGLARKPAAEVGVYLYLEPAFTTVGAALIIYEPVTVSVIAGALLIVMAVYVSERKNNKKKIRKLR